MADNKKKLSWREIDKLKDSSGLAKLRRKVEKKERTSPREEKKIKERYLKELDKLFSREDHEREEWLKRLHQTVGKREFKKLILSFYEKFGLPDEGRDLILFFECEEKELIIKALNKVKENFHKFSAFERQSIVAKLKTMQLSTKDELLAYQLEKAMKELAL